MTNNDWNREILAIAESFNKLEARVFLLENAERSGVLQGCPHSANCSAGARADAQPDSLISSPVPREEVIRRDAKRLLACPFCGSIPEITNPFPPPGYTRISCFNEQCTVNPDTNGMTFDEASKKWNTRWAGGEASPAPTLAAQRERTIPRNDKLTP